MICPRSLMLQTRENSSLSAFLPLVIAGFTTAFILGVQWFVGIVFHREVSSNTNTSEKEHLHESSWFPPAV